MRMNTLSSQMQSIHHIPPHCQLIINQPNSPIRWCSARVSPTQILKSKDIQESVYPRASILDKPIDDDNTAIFTTGMHNLALDRTETDRSGLIGPRPRPNRWSRSGPVSP